MTEIAQELSISRNAVDRLCLSKGISTVSAVDKLRVTDETRAEILRLAREGSTRAAIARVTGVSFSMVGKALRGYAKTRGIPKRSGICASASAVMDRTGCSLPEAAARFVVSPPALYAYRKRRGLWTRSRSERSAR
jgi:predicted transcriptional regulator